MNAKRIFVRFLIFGMMGLLLEVFNGAFGRALAGDINIFGKTSPWMILDYGILGIAIMPIANILIRRRVPLPVRALFYMFGIFAIEYVSGIIFTWGLGLRIWNYSDMPYNLHGQIALSFAVPWYCIGLVAEYLYKRVDACAVVLVRGMRAEQLLELEVAPAKESS